MHRKIGIGILILVIIWLIVFVVRKEPETDNGVFKIGVASGLTGYAANWGTGEVNVIRLLVEEHQNDLPYIIDVIVEDTKVTGLGTVNAFKKLVDFDAVDVIIGPTWGDSFQGGYPIAEKAEIPVISPSAAFESLGDANPYPFAFSTWWPQPQEAQALVDHMKERGITAVHVLHDADAFNTKFTDIFIEHAEGGELLATRSSVPIGTNDFRTEITKLKIIK